MADNYTGQPVINASGNTVGEGILKTTGSLVITNIIGSVNINGNPGNWTGVGSVFGAGGSFNATVLGSVVVTNTVDVNVINESNLVDRNTFSSGTAVAAGGSFTAYMSPNAAGSIFVKQVEFTSTVPLKCVIGFSGVTAGSVQGRFQGVGFALPETIGHKRYDQDLVYPSGTGSILEINTFNRSLTLAADVYLHVSAGQKN